MKKLNDQKKGIKAKIKSANDAIQDGLNKQDEILRQIVKNDK
jgi:hypothetical protein